MTSLESVSLASAVDEVNEAFFFGRALSLAARRRAAKWISSRQGQAGSYAGMPAPTQMDFTEGLRVFTGENVPSRVGRAHVLGEEACRALILLNVADAPVQAALARATQGLLDRLELSRRREANMGRTWRGEYCCARCTCALWRHLAVGGLQSAKPDEWLDTGLKNLRAHRTGNGRWRRFPFFYTLLALSEVDSQGAVEECRHAAPACARLVSRPSDGADIFARRRHALAERILSKA